MEVRFHTFSYLRCSCNTAIVSGDKAEKPNTESEQKELQDIFSFLSVAVYFVHSEDTVVIAS
jgi:hypothetical protein